MSCLFLAPHSFYFSCLFIFLNTAPLPTTTIATTTAMTTESPSWKCYILCSLCNYIPTQFQNRSPPHPSPTLPVFSYTTSSVITFYMAHLQHQFPFIIFCIPDLHSSSCIVTLECQLSMLLSLYITESGYEQTAILVLYSNSSYSYIITTAKQNMKCKREFPVEHHSILALCVHHNAEIF